MSSSVTKFNVGDRVIRVTDVSRVARIIEITPDSVLTYKVEWENNGAKEWFPEHQIFLYNV